jgi:hypothetical protein
MRRQGHLSRLLSSNILLDKILLIDNCLVGTVKDRLGFIDTLERSLV